MEQRGKRSELRYGLADTHLTVGNCKFRLNAENAPMKSTIPKEEQKHAHRWKN